MNRSTPGLPVLHQLPSLPKLMSIESVMPSNYLILCHPLLLLPSIFPSIEVFSNESPLRIRWPKGFPGSSAGKESACNEGDPGSIPGSGRSPGEGIGYPLQYSWVSLVAQLVKNLPAMQETWVGSLGWKDSPGGGHGNPLQYSCLENSMNRGSWWATVPRVAKESDTT